VATIRELVERMYSPISSQKISLSEPRSHHGAVLTISGPQHLVFAGCFSVGEAITGDREEMTQTLYFRDSWIYDKRTPSVPVVKYKSHPVDRRDSH
jgi:hypothetical protein